MHPHTSQIIMKFWEHVAPRNSNGCLLWLGPYQAHNSKTDQDKIGVFPFFRDSLDGTTAHRFAYKMYHPDIDIENLFILHKPECPDLTCIAEPHLYHGNGKDRNANMKSRGIQLGGYKLTDKDRFDMCNKYMAGHSPVRLAEEYGIAVRTVYHITYECRHGFDGKRRKRGAPFTHPGFMTIREQHQPRMVNINRIPSSY